MGSDAQALRDLAAALRKEAAEYETKKMQKVAALLQAGQALAVLKEKLSNVL